MVLANRLILAVSILPMLAGCGGSLEDQRAQMAECGAYVEAFGQYALIVGFGAMMGADEGDGNRFAEMNRKIDAVMLERYPDVVAQMAGIAQSGSQYADMLEPAKASALRQSGVALATQHVEASDDGAVIAQMSSCIDTWEELSKRRES